MGWKSMWMFQCSILFPWKKNEFILEKAFNELKNYNGKTLAYLMGGIPDNTNKLEGKKYNGKTLVYLMGGIPDNTNKLEGNK